MALQCKLLGAEGLAVTWDDALQSVHGLGVAYIGDLRPSPLSIPASGPFI